MADCGAWKQEIARSSSAIFFRLSVNIRSAWTTSLALDSSGLYVADIQPHYLLLLSVVHSNSPSV